MRGTLLGDSFNMPEKNRVESNPNHLDMVVVGGSIPLAPTISATTTSSGNAGPVPATFFRITILLSRITT